MGRTAIAITFVVVAFAFASSDLVDVELGLTFFAVSTPVSTVAHSTEYFLPAIVYTVVVDVGSRSFDFLELVVKTALFP